MHFQLPSLTSGVKYLRILARDEGRGRARIDSIAGARADTRAEFVVLRSNTTHYYMRARARIIT